ncbi:MAG: demethoxyubiquinone hydroxylase family protein [Gammaproteobacteria bacterium]|nr:demethoxyubiquinone hydroxylase family protein [Gammaproteobacteria bacterium]
MSQLDWLRQVLTAFCDEEVLHRDDAAARVGSAGGVTAGAWAFLVGAGSVVGVWIARKV